MFHGYLFCVLSLLHHCDDCTHERSGVLVANTAGTATSVDLGKALWRRRTQRRYDGDLDISRLVHLVSKLTIHEVRAGFLHGSLAVSLRLLAWESSSLRKASKCTQAPGQPFPVLRCVESLLCRGGRFFCQRLRRGCGGSGWLHWMGTPAKGTCEREGLE